MGKRGKGAQSAADLEAKEYPDISHLPDWRAEDISRAEKVIRFVEQLQVTSGMLAGSFIVLREWQKEIIRSIYETDKDNKRLKRSALVTLPRKQGKTAIAAALALAHLCGPESEKRGQIVSAAADKEQASVIFNEMKAMIQENRELEQRCNIKTFNKVIDDDENGSVYRALSSDSKTKHGLNCSFVIFDELAQSPNRNLFDVLATSTAARAEPLFVTISTQSPDPNHVMSELVAYGRKVNAGEIDDPTFHATIYSAPDDADPWAESTWYQCNPALGDFRSLEEMRTSAKQAQRIPQRESTFRALYLNQPVEQDVRFISAKDWDMCQQSFTEKSLKGKKCYAGLDLSSNVDLSSLCLYFPEDDYAVLSYNWCPGERLDLREETDRVPYRTWQRMGYIETAGNGRAIDKTFIAKRLAELANYYDIQTVAYDPWGMDDLERILNTEGIELNLQKFGQGYKDMSAAVSALENLILREQLSHSGNPVLNWAMSNISIEQDPSGNRKTTKSKSRDKIDPAVAMIMAIGVYAKDSPEVIEEYDFDRNLVLEM